VLRELTRSVCRLGSARQLRYRLGLRIIGQIASQLTGGQVVHKRLSLSLERLVRIGDRTVALTDDKVSCLWIEVHGERPLLAALLGPHARAWRPSSTTNLFRYHVKPWKPVGHEVPGVARALRLLSHRRPQQAPTVHHCLCLGRQSVIRLLAALSRAR